MAEDAGNCECSCGQEYRFSRRSGGVVFWPRCGRHAFRPRPLLDAHCLRCGGDLARLVAPGASGATVAA